MTPPPPAMCPHRNSPETGARPRTAGFSLVEVVLSIGIVAFAFVAMFGLIPAGLSTFRQAVENSLGSQIVQRLINEAQQTDFTTLIAAPTGPLRFFDDQGNEVTSIQDSIYSAEVTVTAPTTLPNTSTPATTSLATVTVKLAHNPGRNPSPFAAASKIRFATYTALIAKNQ